MAEKFGRLPAGKGEDRGRIKNKEEGMSRREFLKGGSFLGLGAGAVFLGERAIPRTIEGVKPYAKELLRYKAQFERVVSEGVTIFESAPKPGKSSEFINFDTPQIRLDSGVAARLKEFWKTQFADKADPKRAGPGIRGAFARMRPWDDLIKKEYLNAGVPSELRLIAIQPESQFRLEAESRAGARGPFQIMPKTASRYGLTTENMGLLHSAEVSAGVSAMHLRELYEGIPDKQKPLKDWDLVLSAYNGAFVWGYAESTRGPLTYDGFVRYMGERTHEMREAIKANRYFHAVAENQTPLTIAKRYGVTMAELAAVNPKLKKSAELRAGERLHIPMRNESHARQVFDVVTAGVHENLNYVPKYRALMDFVKREGEERLFASAPEQK